MRKHATAKKIKRLVLIDANAIIHRAFHALPPLSSPSGEPTNAVYGFTTILLRIIREMKPDYVVAAFDTPKPTFRHIAYKQYKATRQKAPDELYIQIPRTKDVLNAFGFRVFEKDGFEADDVIGTITEIVKKNHPDTEVIIVTGDMDTLQLVGPNAKVWTMRKGVSDTVLYDEKAVHERFGFNPESLPDYKGLRGDPSDNIIGVKGIGEKTASELLSSNPHLEDLYKSLEKGKLLASESVKEKLRKEKEEAFFSRQLATIKKDVPIDFGPQNPADISSRKKDIEGLFRELGFFSLIKRLDGDEGGAPKKEKIAAQGLLISDYAMPGLADFKKAANKIRTKSAALSFDEKSNRLILVFPSGENFSLKDKDLSDESFLRFFESDAVKYIFDSKPFYKAAVRYNIQAANIFDLRIVSYLLDSGRAEEDRDAFISRECSTTDLSKSEAEKLSKFFDIGARLEKHLKDEELTNVFEKIEKPLTSILATMELHGIHLDVSWLDKLSKKVSQELLLLTEGIYKQAGQDFNIASPQQVAEILFVKLGIGTKGIRKTGQGKVSTKFSELTKLVGRHPIVEKIIRHRELSKLKTTYLDTLPDFIDKSGRLHTTFNQARTETGRLSSENPNLQNIPIKTEFGRDVRRAFISEKGFVLASFDYSQVELRIAADLSGDEKMIDAFSRGVDIHALTASEVNNVPLDKVTSELRRKAKALNFGVLYGMGPRGFAESAGISVEEAELFIDRYFSNFKGIAAFVERTKEFARVNGFVKTAFGRKRSLPGILSSHPMIRSEAERMAVNMPIQGTATGDVMKLAMISVDRLIKGEYLDKVRMILQIHDELLCEIQDGVADEAIKKIRDAMEGVWKGRVLLKVDVKRGRNWADLE